MPRWLFLSRWSRSAYAVRRHTVLSRGIGSAPVSNPKSVRNPYWHADVVKHRNADTNADQNAQLDKVPFKDSNAIIFVDRNGIIVSNGLAYGFLNCWHVAITDALGLWQRLQISHCVHHAVQHRVSDRDSDGVRDRLLLCDGYVHAVGDLFTNGLINKDTDAVDNIIALLIKNSHYVTLSFA